MKKLTIRSVILSAFLFVISVDASGQWFQKRYGVADINMLSREQLDSSLVSARKEAWVGVAIGGSEDYLFIALLPTVTCRSSASIQLRG